MNDHYAHMHDLRKQTNYTTLTITSRSQLRVENDIAKYNFVIKSLVKDTPKESYQSIYEKAIEIIKSISNNIIVEELRTIPSNETIYEYNTDVIRGYKTVINITFRITITNQNRLLILQLQNSIINETDRNTKVLLNSIDYMLSEKKKQEYERKSIDKGMDDAKEKLSIQMEKSLPIYDVKPTIKYNISNSTINTHSSTSQPMYYYKSTGYSMMERAPDSGGGRGGKNILAFNIISPGKTEISANITLTATMWIVK
jgi:hypothetical protein